MRLKRLFKFLLIFLITISFLVYPIYFTLKLFLRSDTFNRFIENELERKLGLRGHFDPFELRGLSFYSPSFQGVAIRKKVKHPVQIEHLWVHLHLCKSKDIDSTQLNIGQMRLFLASSQEGTSPVAHLAEVKQMHLSIPLLGLASSTLDSVQIENASLLWNGGSTTQGEIRDARVSLKAQGGGSFKDWRVQVDQGVFQQKGLPQLKIQSVEMHYTAPKLHVIKAVLTDMENKGVLNAQGDVWLDSGKQLSFTGQLLDFPLRACLPQKWSQYLNGRLQGQLRAFGTYQNEESVQIKGELSLADGKLYGFPGLDRYEEWLRTSPYREMSLSAARASFDWNQGNFYLHTISLESENLANVNGSVVLFKTEEGRGRELGGFLQLGLASQIVDILPGAREEIFTQAGPPPYLWTIVHLSGTANHPTEDLSPRLQETVVKKIQEKAEKAFQKLGNILDEIFQKNP